MSSPEPSRRPIAARDTAWAAATARFLARRGIRPNAISVFSSVCAALGGVGFVVAGQGSGDRSWVIGMLMAIAGMQSRLLCNLFDGMVAIEGGFKTKSGEVFNELPDRFSDAFILIGAGYATEPLHPGLPALGWLSAVVAVTTAYVRAMGVAAGSRAHFCGPMAKQQRMAVLTAAGVIALGAPAWPGLRWVIPVALALIAAGSLLTVFRRTARIIDDLECR